MTAGGKTKSKQPLGRQIVGHAERVEVKNVQHRCVKQNIDQNAHECIPCQCEQPALPCGLGVFAPLGVRDALNANRRYCYRALLATRRPERLAALSAQYRTAAKAFVNCDSRPAMRASPS